MAATPAAHLWRPSVARLLVLDTFVPVPRGTVAAALPPLQWPAKDPLDVLDYQFDIAPALTGNRGDAISTLDVAIFALPMRGASRERSWGRRGDRT